MQIGFERIQIAAFRQSGYHAQVLTEIVAEMARLFHVGSQLGIAAGFDGEHLVFLRQMEVERAFPCNAVILVELKKDGDEGRQNHQNADFLHPVDEYGCGILRKDKDEQRGQCHGPNPHGAPEPFLVKLIQQPANPRDGCRDIQHRQHGGQPKRERGCRKQVDVLRIIQLCAGVDDHREHAAHGDHHGGGCKSERGPTEGKRGAECTPIQAERQKHCPPEQRVAVGSEYRAEQRKRQPEDGGDAQHNQRGALRELHMTAYRGNAQKRNGKENREISKITGKEKNVHTNSPLKVKNTA